MKQPEQLTINQITETATIADIALYGGLVAVGVVIGMGFLFWIISRTEFNPFK